MTPQTRTRPVAIWLLVGVFMIIVQIILGGITRLTDSGLSITEWQPLLGAIPPSTEQEWIAAFENYKQIAQFKHLNFHFTLEDFKSIYFWEWLHRDWGRLIGIVFLIPFLIFLFQKRIPKNMIMPMIILFLLGGLQSVIGWLMVKSGLNDEDLYVSHIRLAIHFMAALLLLVYTYWLALKFYNVRSISSSIDGKKSLLIWIIVLFSIQLVFGAFMAGLKAAATAATWPDINGSYIPGNLENYRGDSYSGAAVYVNNPIGVHLVHRNLAYLIALLIIIWTVATYRKRKEFGNLVWALPLLLTIVQILLGIFTVLTSDTNQRGKWEGFEWNAQLHQIVGMFLLLALTTVFYKLKERGIYFNAKNARDAG